MYYIYNMRTVIRSTEFDEFYNSFTKDYKKEIQKAEQILNSLQQ